MKTIIKSILLLIVLFFINSHSKISNATETKWYMSYQGGVIDNETGCEFYVEFYFNNNCMCGSLYADGPCGSISITWGMIAGGDDEPEPVSSYDELISKYKMEGSFENEEALVAVWNEAISNATKGD